MGQQSLISHFKNLHGNVLQSDLCSAEGFLGLVYLHRILILGFFEGLVCVLDKLFDAPLAQVKIVAGHQAHHRWLLLLLLLGILQRFVLGIKLSLAC